MWLNKPCKCLVQFDLSSVSIPECFLLLAFWNFQNFNLNALLSKAGVWSHLELNKVSSVDWFVRVPFLILRNNKKIHFCSAESDFIWLLASPCVRPANLFKVDLIHFVPTPAVWSIFDLEIRLCKTQPGWIPIRPIKGVIFTKRQWSKVDQKKINSEVWLWSKINQKLIKR